MNPDEHLFAYGTLLDPAVQVDLFGTPVTMRPAILHGWSRHAGADGYLFIRPLPGGRVEGQVLTLSHEALAIADQWEEVPLYSRERLTVRTADGDCEVWAYTRREATGPLFNGDALTCGKPGPGGPSAR